MIRRDDSVANMTDEASCDGSDGFLIFITTHPQLICCSLRSAWAYEIVSRTDAPLKSEFLSQIEANTGEV